MPSWRSTHCGGAVVAFVLLSLGGAHPGAADATAPAASPATKASSAKASGPGPAAVQIRREIHQLSQPQIDALRAGVALMKSRKESDPTSWAYQANIHGYPSNNATCSPPTIPRQVAWATCQHGQFFFLSWHRMYLYYFERILRAAIREAIHDPTYQFALPYWDYENPKFQDLPQPYRVPADTKTNSLYVAQRSDDCNQGRVCVDGPTGSAKVALSLTPFCSCPGSTSCCNGCTPGLLPDETFGGLFVPAPVHYNRAFGELESQPHNVVHDAIGGDNGWMANPDCAARDPIFWTHHANIDRLWQVWLNQGGGRQNAVDCATWGKNTSFVFFDENKTRVTLTACQILNMVTQLNYQYENLPVNNVKFCPTTQAAAEAAAPSTPPKHQLLAASKQPEIALGDTPVSVAVPVMPQAKARFDALASGSSSGRMRVVIEGLELLQHGAYYRVYLNVPAGQTPDPAGPYYLGQISLFGHAGHGEEASRSFDITDQVKALRQQGQWKGEVQLTFVRANPRKAAAAKAAQPYMRLRRVSVVDR